MAQKNRVILPVQNDMKNSIPFTALPIRRICEFLFIFPVHSNNFIKIE